MIEYYNVVSTFFQLLNGATLNVFHTLLVNIAVLRFQIVNILVWSTLGLPMFEFDNLV